MHLDDLQGQALVSHQLVTKGSDGTLPLDLYASVRQFQLNCACSGHVDASVGQALRCRGLALHLLRSSAKEGIGQSPPHG